MRKIVKKSGKDFTVLNLTDPQLDRNDWEGGSNAVAILKYTLDELTERLHPDLITVSGDISNAADPLDFSCFGDLIDRYGIPWAPIWGNHDNQAGEGPVEKGSADYLSRPLCLYEKGDPALGKGNYVIAIEDEASGKTVEGLILFDSHNMIEYYDADGSFCQLWAKLIPEQLDWYAGQIAALEAIGCHDTTVIMHIPHYGFRQAWKAAWNGQTDPKSLSFADSFDPVLWRDGYKGSLGVKRRSICCYEKDDGVLDLFERLGSTHHVIAGHDHTNNFMINYRGIRHIYALKTGIGRSFAADLTGGTVLTVGENGIKSVRHEVVDISAFLRLKKIKK